MSACLWNGLVLAQTAPSSWASSFFELDPKDRFAFSIVAIACLTGVICTIVVFTWTTLDSMHRRKLEAEMKRDMIERGMSADEIAKIIQATRPRDSLG